MEFDPFSETFFEDPWETYRWLREERPVYHHEELGFWAVSRYEDCMEVHRDSTTYTSTRGLTLDQLRSAAFGVAVDEVGSMIMMDPPMHDRMRKLVSRAFTPRRIAEWRPVVERVIGRYLDALAGAGAWDAVVDLAGPFPVEVISEIVGIPAADRQQLRHWTDAMLEREVGNPFPTAAGIEATIGMHRYVLALVRDKRAHPSDDMIGHLLAAEVEREDGAIERLDDDEVARFVTLLTTAGAETVTKLVGNGVMTFAEHPGERDKLAADPSLAGSAVDEVLRWKAPSQYQGRFSLAARAFHGVTIPADQPVLIMTGAAAGPASTSTSPASATSTWPTSPAPRRSRSRSDGPPLPPNWRANTAKNAGNARRFMSTGGSGPAPPGRTRPPARRRRGRRRGRSCGRRPPPGCAG